MLTFLSIENSEQNAFGIQDREETDRMALLAAGTRIARKLIKKTVIINRRHFLMLLFIGNVRIENNPIFHKRKLLVTTKNPFGISL